MTETWQTIQFPSSESAIALAGHQEANLKLIARQTGANLVLRGLELRIAGQPTPVERATAIVRSLSILWQEAKLIAEADIMTAIHALDTGRSSEYKELQQDILARTRRGELIRAKTFRQRQYIQAIQSHDITFCIGPAGTGKTFLAAVLAVQALLEDKVERIILTRPAVEAGEKLGFLPGDLQQKVDPFLRPLYDALYEFIEAAKIPDLMERGKIEIADEAQNTTPAQLKMVLTRLGFGSRMVVTGDVTQTDLPQQQESGLIAAQKILKSVEGIAFCYLSRADVVRHPLVQKIVSAYEQHEK